MLLLSACLIICFFLKTNISATKEFSCVTVLAGITNELRESQSIVSGTTEFTVNITDLNSLVIYYGIYVKAVSFKFKNGVEQNFGDIKGNHGLLTRQIDLENKKVMSYSVSIIK